MSKKYKLKNSKDSTKVKVGFFEKLKTKPIIIDKVKKLEYENKKQRERIETLEMKIDSIISIKNKK